MAFGTPSLDMASSIGVGHHTNSWTTYTWIRPHVEYCLLNLPFLSSCNRKDVMKLRGCKKNVMMLLGLVVLRYKDKLLGWVFFF